MSIDNLKFVLAQFQIRVTLILQYDVFVSMLITMFAVKLNERIFYCLFVFIANF